MAIKSIPCGGFFYDDESISFDGKVMKSKNKSRFFIVENGDESSSQEYPYVSMFPISQEEYDSNWNYTELALGAIDEETGEIFLDQIFPLIGINGTYIGFRGITGTQGNEEQVYECVNPDYVDDNGILYFSSVKYKFSVTTYNEE